MAAASRRGDAQDRPNRLFCAASPLAPTEPPLFRWIDACPSSNGYQKGCVQHCEKAHEERKRASHYCKVQERQLFHPDPEDLSARRVTLRFLDIIKQVQALMPERLVVKRALDGAI